MNELVTKIVIVNIILLVIALIEMAVLVGFLLGWLAL
jgi:hypothetical protein